MATIAPAVSLGIFIFSSTGTSSTPVESTEAVQEPVIIPGNVMTLIIMFPGMITGSCTASVLSTGVLLVPVLLKMNMPRETAGAIVAMAAVYGMIAPPVNIVVMIIGGGIDMPYIGFDLPLLYMTLPLAILTTLYLGYGYARSADMTAVMEEFARRERAPGGFLLYLPLLVPVSYTHLTL